MDTTQISTFLLNKHKLLLSVAIGQALFSGVVFAEPTDKEQIQALEKRLQALEQQIEKSTISENQRIEQQARSSLTEIFILEPVFDISKGQERPSYKFETPDKSIVLSNSDTTLQLSGQIWLDGIYNSGEMTNRAGFQTSSIAYEDNVTKDDTLFTAGQSKLAFKSFTPTKYGPMTTRFEFDMFQPDGNAGFHLTHLWGEIGDFGAGQTFSGFMDINAFPNTLEYWGPNSMVFTRQPQVRYSTKISEYGRIMFTVEESSSDFALPAGTTHDDYDDLNELPDFTASYFHTADFGYVKASMILRKLGYETQTTKDTTLGWGLNVSGNINLTASDSIQFQFVLGEGLGRYINDPCCSYYSDETGGSDAGLNSQGELTAIPVTGGFAYYGKQWSKKWSSAVGYSYLTMDNLSTQQDKAFKNSAYTTANIIWYPIEQVKAGIEIQYGDVQSKSGLEGDNFRLQTSFGFKY